MPNAWIEALKKWNEGKGMWCLPKKGTKDYDEVRALMPPKPEKAKKEKAPKASKEEPLPKIAEKVTREELLGMLETYAEDRRKLSTVKGAKLRKGMDRIDKLEGVVKEKIKEMDAAAAAPKAKRVIKVSKKVHEAAAPANTFEKMSGEERMKAISEHLAKRSEEKKGEEKSDAEMRKHVKKLLLEQVTNPGSEIAKKLEALSAKEKKIMKELEKEEKKFAKEKLGSLKKLTAVKSTISAYRMAHYGGEAKKDEKTRAIIAQRVEKKKFKNIYGEL